MFDIETFWIRLSEPMLTTLGVSFILSVLFTPLFRDLAVRIGLVDAPDGRRKHQRQAIPRGGGLAVFAAALIGILTLGQFGFSGGGELLRELHLENLFWACCVLAGVGLVDDFIGLRGRHKLAGQFVAISILIWCDHLEIGHFALFGYEMDTGAFGYILTYCWMIGIINAINLIDGMDGLLGLIGLLICLSLAVVAAMLGNTYVAIVSTALAGALIGFLCFNLPPASVYLGDSGSMVIGLVVGALSIKGSVKAPTAMALAVPIAILILPILDTTAAITRRKLTGRSIYTTDRGHLHHCLLRSGMNQPAVLALVLVLGLIASAGAVASTLLHNDLYSMAAVAIVVVTLVAGRLFGHAEFTLIKEKLRALVDLSWNGNRAGRSHQLSVRLQGSVRWQGIWEELSTAAFRYNFRTLCLDVNAPAMHEGYHARWDRFGAPSSGEEAQDWRADLPISLEGRVIGRLTAAGLCDEQPIWAKLQQLAEIVKATELHIHRLTEQPSFVPEATPTPAYANAVSAAS